MILAYSFNCFRFTNKTRTCSRTRIRVRSGYTLLELLLALALTVIVISTIATAIQVNLFSLARAQASIERKQIARSVLAMIGNDIRAAVQFRAADFSGLEEVLLSQQLVAGITPLTDDETTDEGLEATDTPAFADVASTTEDDEVEEDDWSIGLIGQSNYIWLDISRLPRIDQYHPLIRTAQDDVRTGSDIKQVLYYVAESSGRNQSEVLQATDSGGSSRSQMGLFRDEIDRAVVFYQGGLDPATPKEYSQLVATEVVNISFRYFDGNDWQTQWDSTENNGFPPAVEINITVDSTPQADFDGSGFQQDGRYEQYRSVVHLPLAEIDDSEDEDE